MPLENLNENIRLELIRTRKNAGMTQMDVAAKSEIFGVGRLLDQNAVVRIEKQPLAMDFIKLLAYLSAVGMSIEAFYELLNKCAYEDESNTVKIRPRDEITKKQSVLILETLMKVRALIETLPERHQAVLSMDAFNRIESYLTKTKLIIGFIGGTNAGKSTLINVIIGQPLLPTSMSATTRMLSLVMHVSDKPSYIIGSVAVFKKGFHPMMLFDEAAIKQYLIAQGDKSILSGHRIDTEAYIAVVFAEADVLNHVWLLDTPGDLENHSDTEMVISSAALIDGVVFMSDMNDFLKPNEWGLMANVMRLKPAISSDSPFDHLLLVPSQCDSKTEIEAVTKTGVSRIEGLQEQLDTLVFSSWMEGKYVDHFPTSEQLIARIQPFGREHHTLRTQTLSKIQELAKYLMPHKESELVATVEYEIKNNLKSNLIRTLESLEFVKLQGDKRADSIKELELKVADASKAVTDNFHDLLDALDGNKKADIKAMKAYFEDITSQAGLTDIIEEMYPDQKDAQEEIGNYVGQLLIIEMAKIFKQRGATISDAIIGFLDEWNNLMDKSNHYSYSIFKGGFYGLSNIGALAFCPSLNEVNVTENMILGAKALGTPITNGVTLANNIGSITYRHVGGGSWQSYLAKKTANVIRNEDLWKTIEPLMVNFWDGTEQAITNGLKSLNVSAQDAVSYAKSSGDLNLSNYDDKVDDHISKIKQALELLTHNKL
jgi:transcriptional regulator with XRE-family HTH domain